MTPNHLRPASQTDLDHARERLERANFKLGKARGKSILSTAQAATDAQDLQDCLAAAADAENEFARVAERFVAPARDQPAAEATEAVQAGQVIATFTTTIPNGEASIVSGGDPFGPDDKPLHDAFRSVV